MDPVLFSQIIELANVGVAELRDRAGFALETFQSFGLLRKMRGKNFDGNSAIEASIQIYL